MTINLIVTDTDVIAISMDSNVSFGGSKVGFSFTMRLSLTITATPPA